MTWKGFLSAVLAVPVLALFLGIGFLSLKIGQSWDARSTDMLIAGLISVCSLGFMFGIVILALIVGVPMGLRYLREYQAGRRLHAALDREQTLPAPYVLPGQMPGQYRGQLPNWAAGPPQIEDKSAGSFQTLGADTCDLWGQQPGIGQATALGQPPGNAAGQSESVYDDVTPDGW